MAEATILTKGIHINHPGWEGVSLECSDGETYQCTKFKSIQAVFVGSNHTSAICAVNATWSGQTVTISIKGDDTTDIQISILIIGGDS